MPICIECRYPVPQLYHISTSSKPSTRPASPTAPTPGGEAKRSSAGASDVRLTQCPRCKRFADKYVEHDFVVLFIDLVLVKPQVYRHLLFNRLGREDDAFEPSIIRLGALLLLFDVYITWSHIEALPQSLVATSPVPGLPILEQYLFYLLLCAAMTVTQHLTIRRLAKLPLMQSAWGTAVQGTGSPVAVSHARNGSGGHGGTPGGTPGGNSQGGINSGTGTSTPALGATGGSGSHTPAPPAPPANANANAISTALFVSSCMKLFPILMVVWKYNDASGQLSRWVTWAVALQNMEALRILMGCPWWIAACLVAAGGLVRWIVYRTILVAVGLGQVDI